ncbi:DNA glycosylase [Mycena alexandri]|uniref:DNA glycosylase n=1 Tax=Mycena alexandri TaxID=1745969 RepID=A0AAD6TF98_9AGAR|nr:DNA glycosylase [Mycena alexandri]
MLRRISLFKMPATRSSTSSPVKRKLESTEPAKSPKKFKPSSKPVQTATGAPSEPEFVPADAVLTFSFEDAKKHLINADHRFDDVFKRLECKPFQQLEQVHPFRALASSILGQQISVMAAKSIKHKFIRLYDESIPEKHSDYQPSDSAAFFPTPQQVAETDIATLRTAGLSARKAEYITDLAARFADGRLSTTKLIESDDDELAEMLIEVRGIGRWTVDMFALFSLRRSDILPVGDLGVQRGLVRWVLSQHVPAYSFSASPAKDKAVSPTKKKAKKSKEDDDALPVFEQSSEATEETPRTPPPAEDGSAMIPLPPTFTPSIKRTLAKAAQDDGVQPLPEGLTVAELKSRLDGKKKIKGAFLSPTHMEQLTASWRPYRSLGVYYMWALADV